jgi:hypothetical protein
MFSQIYTYSNESSLVLGNYEFIENCLNLNNKRPMEFGQAEDLTTRGGSSKKMREWNVNNSQQHDRMVMPLQHGKCEKRNERERNRVRLMNQEFETLADLVFRANFKSEVDQFDEENKENLAPPPPPPRRKRQYSKLNILKISIRYIQYLQDLLLSSESESEVEEEENNSMNYLQMSFLTGEMDSTFSSPSSSFATTTSTMSTSTSQFEPEFDFNDSLLFI